MTDRKVHSVIPKPTTSVAEKLGLDDVNLTITLSEEELTAARETIQTETQKTRMVLIVLGVLNAISFLIGKYAF